MENPPLALFLVLLLAAPAGAPPTADRRRAVDGMIHSAALHSYPRHHKTAVPYSVSLPPSLSGAAVSARAMRFRAGRLRRRGVGFNAFRLNAGVVARPHSKRLLIVLQNLGDLSGSLYSIPGHRLVSPVLGLLVYDAVGTNSTELDVRVTGEPIEVNFSRVAGVEEIKEGFLCAAFGLGGRVEVSGGGRVCLVKGQGHVGLVAEGGRGKEVRTWKVVVATATAGVVAAAMIGLVVVAVAKGRRKKCRLAEMERRAYEDEALRVSMVGNLRAYAAAAVRTAPAMESEEGLPI